MSKPEEFNDWPTELAVNWEYRAVVKRIVDGDTLYLGFDMGLNQYAYHPIRLAEVEAPELFSGLFRDRGAQAKAQLELICEVGTKCIVHTEKDHMSFQRYVGWIQLRDGRSVNVLMTQWLEEMGY